MRNVLTQGKSLQGHQRPSAQTGKRGWREARACPRSPRVNGTGKLPYSPRPHSSNAQEVALQEMWTQELLACLPWPLRDIHQVSSGGSPHQEAGCQVGSNMPAFPDRLAHSLGSHCATATPPAPSTHRAIVCPRHFKQPCSLAANTAPRPSIARSPGAEHPCPSPKPQRAATPPILEPSRDQRVEMTCPKSQRPKSKSLDSLLNYCFLRTPPLLCTCTPGLLDTPPSGSALDWPLTTPPRVCEYPHFTGREADWGREGVCQGHPGTVMALRPGHESQPTPSSSCKNSSELHPGEKCPNKSSRRGCVPDTQRPGSLPEIVHSPGTRVPSPCPGETQLEASRRVRTQGTLAQGDGNPSRENNRCRWGQIRGALQDLPGGLVAKTPRPQCRGLWFHPWWNQVPRAATKSLRATLRCMQRKTEDPKCWN